MHLTILRLCGTASLARFAVGTTAQAGAGDTSLRLVAGADALPTRGDFGRPIAGRGSLLDLTA